ncbi:multidrug ABC transporter substrate-binding protein [Algimonas arctica]|uniref:Multidrug ABC transporter substrate-binding protein n=1 Tax=Algimonas arctica TaxID=1479486 RepID=A0A8J3CRN9_9PROT|nr:ABC transporter permease [Algimonas arctica]GHA90836.1 multidrug ABC transporter substrate-binding protein [Algimonas arctica]
MAEVTQNAPFGSVERKISMRYLRAKKTHGGVGFIAVISFTCIMLAIAAMITIMSIMNGFRADMIRLTIGSEGHIYVQSVQPDITVAEIEALEQRMQAIPGVENAFQFTQHFTGVQANGQFALAQVIGIAKDDLMAFELIADGVIQGDLRSLGEGEGSDHAIAIGSAMAAGLSLQVGDRLLVYSPRTRQTISGAVPVRKTYTIGAIFDVGLFVTNQTYIYMDLDEATLLFEGGKVKGDIQLRLEDPDEIDELRPQIFEQAGQPIRQMTWKDRNQSTASALRVEQVAMRLIFMIVVIIAAFPVLASMIMLVKNKSRDIAILRTIGMTRAGILRIFLMSGATVGILGTLVGLIVGVLFCLNLYSIQLFIEGIMGVQLFPQDVYQLTDRIPVKIVWSEVASVALWGFMISAMAVFWPAWQASKIDPVEALRYD